MRILTVQEPYASAIIHAGKGIENRVNWRYRYRGPLAIHAGVTPFPEPDWAEGDRWRLATERTRAARAPVALGAIVGVVDLVDAHPAHETPEGWCCQPWGEAGNNPAHRGRLRHLVVTNPRPLPKPVPATGRQGLWHDRDALHEVWRQITRLHLPGNEQR